MMKMMSVKVNNVEKYAENYKYIVARVCDGELWFYGAWNNEDKAKEVAYEVNGLVVIND